VISSTENASSVVAIIGVVAIRPPTGVISVVFRILKAWLPAGIRARSSVNQEVSEKDERVEGMK
jgi:hypothetical protein